MVRAIGPSSVREESADEKIPGTRESSAPAAQVIRRAEKQLL